MKNNKFSKAILSLLLGAMVALAGCGNGESIIINNGSDNDLYQMSVRPVGLDMKGVKGFAVLGNHDVTRADMESGNREIDEEVNDEVIQEPINIPAPYSLYSINEKNEISLSVFYFEATTTNEGLQEIIENELKGAIQVVPSLLTDLGKYILFSGCQFYVCKAGLSEELQQICDMIIEKQQQMYFGIPQEYLLRKSDGALFDITEQELFFFYSKNINEYGVEFVVGSSKWSSSLESIIPGTYFTHKDNLYVANREFDFRGLRKIVDNGDAIDVSTVTQMGSCRDVIVDKDDNVYVQTQDEFHIYLAKGGFDILDSKYYEGYISMENDDQGNAYLFTKDSYDNGKGFIVTSLADGKPQEIYNTGYDFWWHKNNLGLLHVLASINHPSDDIFESNSGSFTYPLGYQNNAFWWFLGYSNGNYDPNLQDTYTTLLFKYDPTKNEAELVDFPANIKAALEAQYDYMSFGKTCCGVRVDGINIEVTTIDIVNETVTTKTYEVEPISSIVGRKYQVAQFATPTLYVSGRNNINGAPAMVSINLLTGDNSASFAGDARSVVTLLRIN